MNKPTSKLPVLVVEDDPEVRCLLEREIRDQGYSVHTATHGEEALGLLEQDVFAIVITDIRMPGMDGVELTRRIKSVRPEIEIILITGYASVDTASRAVRLGASDYLTKPFGDLSRIHESLDRAVASYRERQAARDQVRELETHRGTLVQLLDRLPIGVLLVGGQGRVLLENSAARAILDQRDGLSLGDDGQLHIVAGPGDALASALDRAIRFSDTARLGGAVLLPRPSAATPYSVLVTPLGDVKREVAADQHAAALFVSDPDHRPETAEQLLRGLYGLTPSEARLTAVLMQGRSVEDAAAELEVSINTVRTHLKRVFSKTGTTRQGDLISLLLSGPALLRLGEPG